MKVTFVVAGLLLLASPARAQQVLSFGSAITREITGGETHSYIFTADAGDMVSGPVELLGPEARLAFLDGANNLVDGARIRGFYLGGTAGRRVGFVAPTSGSYQLRLAAAGSQRGTYTLQLDKVDVAARLRGIVVTPKEVNASERIRRLAGDIAARRNGAVDEFWREVAGKGPLIEPLT